MSLLQALTSRMAGTKTYAGAIDLDGTNDYLSRASDFTGNADGKTFTFSAWVYMPDSASGNQPVYVAQGANAFFRVYFSSTGTLYVTGRNAANALILSGATTSLPLSAGTFHHVLISIDLANTSNRYIYVNDTPATCSFSTYTNDAIAFIQSAHYVGLEPASTYAKSRLAHVFLDYTYRDLSNSTNRRLFITADRKPAQGQAALNPILYLPMDDPTTAHINQGTGGNFTLNGVVARSGRGPNQFNVPYSDLDGAADYLRHIGSMCANGKQMTISICFNADTITNTYFFHYGDNTSSGSVIALQLYNGEVGIWGADGGAYTLRAVAPVKTGRNYHLLISVDMSDSAKRHFVLNGNTSAATWSTYTNSNFAFSQTSQTVGAGWNGSPGIWMDGKIGNLWFNNSYIDLSNASNLAKFVTGTGIDAKPVSLGANGELPTGTSPLIYLPMYGNNAGKNYGTGGDFTVNSGPYPGARGPNEFWGNKADFDGSTGKLLNGAMSAGADSKTFSGSFYITPDSTGTSLPLFSLHDNPGVKLWLDKSGDFLQFRAKNAAGTTILDVNNTSGNFIAGTAYQVLFCFDLSDAGKRFIYISGVSTTLNAATYTNDAVGFSLVELACIGVDDYTTPSTYFDGRISEFYFTTDYIDFSLEANRLLFRDAFGNPTDLPSLIESGAVPNPAVYMRFDPADQGRNDGTGGNFTKSGTITDGGQL